LTYISNAFCGVLIYLSHNNLVIDIKFAGIVWEQTDYFHVSTALLFIAVAMEFSLLRKLACNKKQLM